MFSDGNFHFANKKRFFFFVVVVVVVVVVAKTKQNKRVHSLRGSTNPLGFCLRINFDGHFAHKARKCACVCVCVCVCECVCVCVCVCVSVFVF